MQLAPSASARHEQRQERLAAVAQRELMQRQGEQAARQLHQRARAGHQSLRALLLRLRRSPREVQLQVLEHVQQYYLAKQATRVAARVIALPPVQLAMRSAFAAVSLASAVRFRLNALGARVHDATLGRVQRSLPYRCVEAYAAMIAADARVAHQLHMDAASLASFAHSSRFISATPASSSLSPLAPGSSRLAAIGWRTRRFVYALARFTGQSRRLLFARSIRHWPLDAAMLYFQLLLLFLPQADQQYDSVRESLVDCLRWYESHEREHECRPAASSTTAAARHARLQIEGQRSTDDSFLADLTALNSSASPVRIVRRRRGAAGAGGAGSSGLFSPASCDESPLSPSTPADVMRSRSRLHTRADSLLDFTSPQGTPMLSPQTSFSPAAPAALHLPPISSATRPALSQWGLASHASLAGAAGSLASSSSSHAFSVASSSALDTSYAQGAYARAMDLLAREGIDLNDIGMEDDSLMHDSMREEEDGGNVSDVGGTGGSEWDRQSQGSARELVFSECGDIVADGDATDETEIEAADHLARRAIDALLAPAPVRRADLSVSELLDHTTSASEVEQPGHSSPEGRQREYLEGADVAASASVPSSGPRPRLVLPLHLHASTRHLLEAQRLLVRLHGLLSDMCTSHAIVLEVCNEELRSWNTELPLGASADAAAAAVAASSPAAAAPSSEPSAAAADVVAPALHFLFSDLTEPAGIDQLVSTLSSLSAHKRALVASSFFLMLLHPAADSSASAADDAFAAALQTLSTNAGRHPLLGALLHSRQVALISSTIRAQAPVAEDAAQEQRLLTLVDSILRVVEQGVMDMAQQQQAAAAAAEATKQ